MTYLSSTKVDDNVMKYKQLTHQERYQISYLSSMVLKRKIIAQSSYYYAPKTQGFTVDRRKENGKRAIRISETVWDYIEHKLEE